MIWRGATLYDGHRSVAHTTADTVTVGETVLRVTSDNPVDFRAVDAATGQEYLLRKAGFTVSRYVADCAGRRYSLNRSGFDLLSGAVAPKREIRDAADEIVAVTRGSASGELDVDVTARAELVDIVFLSWALTFVDAPARRTRY